jgi:3-deoxy-D-manno-octulosonic-acid transferase
MTRAGRIVQRRPRPRALRATLSALTRRREGWESEFVRESWGFLPAAIARAASGRSAIWISSAPGGELIQTYSLCTRLKEALPDSRIFLSTTNARSLGFARTVPGADGVFFSPWDLHGPVRRVLRTLRPRLVLAVEAALDPVLYREARRLGVTTMLASGYMANRYDSHPTYERSMALRVFGHLDWIGAKGEEDRQGFLDLGLPPERVVVLGDLRYDREYFAVSAAERDRFRELLGVALGETLLVAGSIRAEEEALVIDGFLEARRSLPGLRLLIAPRFPQEVELVSAALRSRGEPFHRRTELHGGPSRGVLILDSFGELARLYSLAAFVFLGGSVFPQDRVGLGQNMIEPLAQGVPIFFGPHMNHWADIVASMTAIYPGLRVTRAGELARGIVELDRRPDLVGRLQALARTVMEERSGGLREHVAFIQKLLMAA